MINTDSIVREVKAPIDMFQFNTVGEKEMSKIFFKKGETMVRVTTSGKNVEEEKFITMKENTPFQLTPKGVEVFVKKEKTDTVLYGGSKPYEYKKFILIQDDIKDMYNFNRDGKRLFLSVPDFINTCNEKTGLVYFLQ